jgi:adenylate cyclase
MGYQSDYTSRAQRLTARFPLATFLMIQVTFWIFANILLLLVTYLPARSLAATYNVGTPGSLPLLLLLASTMGVLYGVSLGLAESFLAKATFRKKTLAWTLLFKTLVSLSLLTLIVTGLRLLVSNRYQPVLSPASWVYLYYTLIVYYFFMTLMINFINQMNRRYGPGVLLPLLLGKYRNPQEEERIFMFMDLQSSTAIAEHLGHLQYSAFIRDCFSDINGAIYLYNAQIYQYVGDEVVLTWNTTEGVKNFACIRFFFACEHRLKMRTRYYQAQYGVLPVFKAGLHTGMVTAVEVGEIKREIAYHGDVLNTAARIQSVCNDFGKTLLISESLLQRLGHLGKGLTAAALGSILPRGKIQRVAIAAVEKAGNHI